MLELIDQVTAYMEKHGFKVVEGKLKRGDPLLRETEQKCKYFKEGFGYPVRVKVYKKDDNNRHMYVSFVKGDLDFAERVGKDEWFSHVFEALCKKHNLPY
jgi:hypothetical protein